MSTEGIIEKIRRQSQERVREIASNGRDEAEKRYQEILDQTQQEVTELTQKAEKDAQELFEASRLSAELEVRKNSLSAKRSLLDEAFEKALNEMTAADEQKKAGFYEELILQNVPAEGAQITVNGQDRQMAERLMPQWQRKLADRYGHTVPLMLAPENGSFSGGLFLTCDTYDIDATFEQILQDVRDDHEIEIAQCLFGVEE